MHRTAAAIALVALLAFTPGCAMSGGARATLIGGGVASILLGGAVVQTVAVDGNHNGVNGTTLDDDVVGLGPATVLVLGGLVMIVAGVTAHSPPRSERADAMELRARPTTYDVGGGVTVYAPLVAPLPEVATTADVLRLAKQVRSAANHGECSAARATLATIEAADRAYGRALADGPVMEPCRAVP